MENYFIIHNDEGDTHVVMLSKNELLDRLNEDYYGSDIEFLDTMPDNTDTNYWECKTLIIRGEIVTPEQKRRVIEYNIK